MIRQLSSCALALTVMLGSSSLAAQTPAAAVGHVKISGVVAQPGTYTFEPGVTRLNDAAVIAQVSSRAWFLGAALLRQSALESQQRLKAGLLFELSANRVHAQAKNDAALAALVERLHAAVERMPVTGRVVAELDPLQQMLIDNNDLLEPGDHLLYPLRPEHVRVTGAVAEDCLLQHDPALKMTDYLAQCPRHAAADRNDAYLVQPNGQWQRLGIAYWNEQAANVAVGAIIYLPVASGKLSPETLEFNRDMAAMLATQYTLGGRFSE